MGSGLTFASASGGAADADLAGRRSFEILQFAIRATWVSRNTAMQRWFTKFDHGRG